MRVAGACTIALMLASAGYAADVDWKLYGSASLAGPSFCFYDAKSAARLPDGHIRVWTKCLAQQDLDALDITTELGKQIVDDAVKKLNAGYIPPIIVIGKMDIKQLSQVLAYEETANFGAIEPQAQLFDELNCSERMMRNLSGIIQTNGQSVFKNTPSNWESVPPEGNGATLLKILCPVQGHGQSGN